MDEGPRKCRLHEGSLCVSGLISELKLAVPWGHIAAKAWGSHQSPPVLCLHGWLDNANSFDRIIPLLPKGGRAAEWKPRGEAAGLRENQEGEVADLDAFPYPFPLSQTFITLPWISGVMGCHPIIAQVSRMTTKTS